MPIRVECDCGKSIDLPDSYGGKRVKCPACQKGVAVPALIIHDDEPALPIVDTSDKPPDKPKAGPQLTPEQLGMIAQLLDNSNEIKFRLGCIVWMLIALLVGLFFGMININSNVTHRY